MGNKSLQYTSYSGGINYGLQLQFWLCPKLINVTVTAQGGNPRELIDQRNRLQLHFLISVELMSDCSFRISERKQKGGFVCKRVVLANVPSFRFFVLSFRVLYPRSGFGVPLCCCFVPSLRVLGVQGTSTKTTLLETTLLRAPEIGPFFEFQGPADRGGGLKRGCFPIWTCLSFFVLFCPSWDFPDVSGIFPVCLGIVRGISRFVLFLFLSLLSYSTYEEQSRKGPGLPSLKNWFGNNVVTHRLTLGQMRTTK